MTMNNFDPKEREARKRAEFYQQTAIPSGNWHHLATRLLRTLWAIFIAEHWHHSRTRQ